jgi:hypothetical protein
MAVEPPDFGLPPLPVCTVCGDILPSREYPEARTCREWADATAARLGDMLGEETYRDLMLVRGLC